jgi:type IX secretion system substrate protein
MKKIVLLITLISTLGVSAQNWNPINLNSEYNYKIDTAQLITNTIFVDSFSVSGNDSIYYLNRIMTNCDTCSNTSYKLKNQPQFLMRRVIKKTDSLFIFQDSTEFRLNPLKTLGESWMYDSINNTTAIVDSLYTQIVFGVVDSIKRITLSNNQTIILSKSFGILRFPYVNNNYFVLLGLRNNTLIFGEQLPRFWDFFNYEINDILQWKDYSYCGGGAHSSNTTYFKGTVLSKSIIGDTVSYQIQGKKHYRHYNDFQGTTITKDSFNLTLTFIDSISHLSNNYPNEVSNRSPNWSYSPYTPTIFYMENGLQKKLIDFFYNPFMIVNPANNPDVVAPSGFPYGLPKSIFTVGLGECITYSPGISCIDIQCMEGRIHLGDTIGTIYPDSFYGIDVEEEEEIKNEQNNNDLIIYPNPVSDQLSINNKLTIYKISITDVSGRLVMTIKENISVINVTNLPSGVYFIKIDTDIGSVTSKFVKQ